MSNLGSFILAVDTTSQRSSVALARAGRVIAVHGLESAAQQSIELWETVDGLLRQAGSSIVDVTAFAVATGPGSFTGLRVGLAAAMGYANATSKPLYGATSLELTAIAGGACEDVLVMLNAHRKEVYAQRFRVTGTGQIEALSEPIVAAPEAVLRSHGDGPTRFIGDGANLYVDLIEAAAARCGGLDVPQVQAPLGERWQFGPSPSFLAPTLALLASRLEASGIRPVPVEPTYIRPSEAEINLAAGRLGIAGDRP